MEQFIRDNESKAIINTDVSSIAARRAQRQNHQKIQQLTQEIHQLKTEMEHIKNLLNTIIASRG